MKTASVQLDGPVSRSSAASGMDLPPGRGRVGPPERSVISFRARHDLEDATAEQIVAWAAQTFGDGLTVASSTPDAVIIDLVSACWHGGYEEIALLTATT